MKSRKSDASEGFTSDCLLHCPDILFSHLATVFCGWMIHGAVTSSALACTFLPLLKPQKDEKQTSSCHAIVGSSKILKHFGTTVLEVWGGVLRSGGFQFGYKRGASTTQCTWLVQEVVQHYLQSGCNPSLRSLTAPGPSRRQSGTSWSIGFLQVFLLSWSGYCFTATRTSTHGLTGAASVAHKFVFVMEQERGPFLSGCLVLLHIPPATEALDPWGWLPTDWAYHGGL